MCHVTIKQRLLVHVLINKVAGMKLFRAQALALAVLTTCCVVHLSTALTIEVRKSCKLSLMIKLMTSYFSQFVYVYVYIRVPVQLT